MGFTAEQRGQRKTLSKEFRSGYIIPDKGDFGAKKITRVKRILYQKKRINSSKKTQRFQMCAPNNRVIKYVKRKLIELTGELEKYTITGGNFNASLSTIERTTK